MCDHCCSGSSSLVQTLDELQFENSIFGACANGDLEKVKKCLLKVADINAQDTAGHTALHYAARNGSMAICKLLIEDSRADVNAKTRSCGSTALHRAAYMCFVDIVELLIKKGASVTEQDCDGKTALHKCVESKRAKFLECAKVIIKVNAKVVSIADKHGKRPGDYCDEVNSLTFL